MPKVSICIPSYNQPLFLKRLLESIFEQTFTDFEIIITDDTPDHSVKNIVENFCDIRILYFKNKKRLGSPENWNEAIRHAEGEYIKIMHHDDWFTDKESLEKFVDLTSDGYYDFVFSGSKAMFENSDIYFTSIDTKQFENMRKKPSSLLKGNIIGGPSSILFRKKLNLFFDNMLMWLVDIEFYYRIFILKIKCNYTSESLIISFIGKDRISNLCYSNSQIEIPEYLYVIKKHKINSLDVIIYVVNYFNKLNVLTYQNIRDCGYNYKVNFKLRLVLCLRNVRLIGREHPCFF